MIIRFPFPYLVFALFLLAACGNDAARTDAEAGCTATSSVYQPAEVALSSGKGAGEVSRLLLDNFKAVSDATTGALNPTASQEFVCLAEALSGKHPEDTTAALPLYRAAEVVRAMNNPAKAAEIYRRVYDQYPTFSKSPESLFMLAFTYDEDLKDFDAARTVYNDFLSKYPGHSFADDTEMLLRNLGKTSEEMLKELGTE